MSELFLSLVSMWSSIKGELLFLECAESEHGVCVPQPRALAKSSLWAHEHCIIC